MKSFSGISQFLESQSGPVESEGSFTIDSHRAFQKLSQFQLPSPGHWVVKLVQAAVRMEAKRIDFQFGRKYLKINIEMDSPPSADEILDDVLQGGLGLDPARQHLVTGIRYIWGRYPKELQWECHHDQGWSQVCAITGGTQKESTPPSSYRGIKMLVHATAVKPKRNLLRFEAEPTLTCAKALADLCWMAPIPVTVDTRRIDNPFQRSYTHATLLSGPRQGLLGVWLEECESGGFPVRLPKNPGESDGFGAIRQKKPAKANGYFEHRSCGAREVFLVDYLLSVYYTEGGATSNKLWWVKDGALIGPVELTGWATQPLDIFFNGRDLRTDLGGFSPASSDFRKEMATALDTLKMVMFQLKEQGCPGKVVKALEKKVSRIEGLVEAKNEELSKKGFQALEQMELTPDNLPDYLHRLFMLDAESNDAVGASRYLSAYRRFFWHGQTLEGEIARRWWGSVINYFQDSEEEEQAAPPALTRARLKLAQITSEPLEVRELVLRATRGAIGSYALSCGIPDPLLGLCFLELARQSPELVSPPMWEAVVGIAEIGYKDDIDRLLAEELRCAEGFEKLVPASLRERVTFVHRHGPWQAPPEDNYGTTSALRQHWREMNLLWAVPRTVGIMGLGTLSFKLGINLGIWGFVAAVGASQKLLDNELQPLWCERKAKEILESLQLPEELK